MCDQAVSCVGHTMICDDIWYMSVIHLESTNIVRYWSVSNALTIKTTASHWIWRCYRNRWANRGTNHALKVGGPGLAKLQIGVSSTSPISSADSWCQTRQVTCQIIKYNIPWYRVTRVWRISNLHSYHGKPWTTRFKTDRFTGSWDHSRCYNSVCNRPLQWFTMYYKLSTAFNAFQEFSKSIRLFFTRDAVWRRVVPGIGSALMGRLVKMDTPSRSAMEQSPSVWVPAVPRERQNTSK